MEWSDTYRLKTLINPYQNPVKRINSEKWIENKVKRYDEISSAADPLSLEEISQDSDKLKPRLK